MDGIGQFLQLGDAGDERGALVQLGLGIVLCIVQRLGKGIVFGLVRVGGIIKDTL